jgi:hypothetical protein|nr:MAG TPA: hypothetical protein [Caudoviricetes sp.]
MENQKVIIISNGRTTDIMVNGRLYGDGVAKVEFVHDHKDKPNNARLLIKKKMDEAEMLKKLCQPIIDWLKKNHNPYTQVQVSIDSIEMVQKTRVIPIGDQIGDEE